MLKFTHIAVSAAVALILPAAYAASAPLNMLTAPDMASRGILASPITHFEEGATSKSDIPAAINRNYAKIIEQNFARLNATDTNSLVDNLSDVELKSIAQLYANANADAHRSGALLLVAADRMDGQHLARISKFFGYAPVYDAITKVAPTKAQNFAQNAPIVYTAPVAGASTPMTTMVMALPEASPSAVKLAVAVGGVIAPMQAFKPAISMTFDQLYTGFRTLQVGSMASTAALYETMVYSGMQLSGAYAGGYAVGTGMTWLAQTYAPDWYYGTFVNAVGNTVDWFQTTANTVGSFYGSSIYDLGHYEAATAPVMNVPSTAQTSMQDTGGDFGVTSAWNTVWVNAPSNCPRGQKCPPPMEH
jgi:hypothetical protein